MRKQREQVFRVGQIGQQVDATLCAALLLVDAQQVAQRSEILQQLVAAFAKAGTTVYDGARSAGKDLMSLESLKKDVAAAVDSLRGELLSLSHAIHQEPELALEEFKAARRLTEAVARHDLPVQRATKIEMYINLKTARSFGITIPLPLSGRANEVFE